MPTSCSGLPYQTFYDVVQEDNDGQVHPLPLLWPGSMEGEPNLSLTYGIRYELHPGYYDAHGDIGNFVPISGSGESIYPDGAASLLATTFLASANACTPYGPTTGSTYQRGSLHARALQQPGRLSQGLEKISSPAVHAAVRLCLPAVQQ